MKSNSENLLLNRKLTKVKATYLCYTHINRQKKMTLVSHGLRLLRLDNKISNPTQLPKSN